MQPEARGVWLLSSMQRPDGLRRFIESYRAQDEDAFVVLHLWKNDPCADEYLKVDIPDHWGLIWWDHPQWVGDLLNYTLHTEKEALYYGFLADDVELMTPFSKVLGEAAQPGYISYPDDGINGKRLCTHFCIGGCLARAVGWLAHPAIKHTCLDNVWHTIGMNLELLRYKPDVRYKHWHPMTEEVEKDAIHERAESVSDDDKKRFKQWYKGPEVMVDIGRAFLMAKAEGLWCATPK